MLIASSTIFAASKSETDNNQKLFRINNVDNDRYVRTDLRYTHSVVFSVPGAKVLDAGAGGAANNLKNGAQICSGATVTLTSSLGGVWASGGDFIGSMLEVPGAYDVPDEDGCWPIPDHNAAVSPDRPITWSKAKYNLYIPEEDCWSDQNCWGNEGMLTNQPVEYDTVIFGPVDGKRGSVNYICYGEDDPLIKKGGANYNNPAPKEIVDGNSVSYSVALNQEGSYTIESQAKIKGCVAIVRYPNCPSYGLDYEQVLGRTAAQGNANGPKYSFTMSEKPTLSLTVINPNPDIDNVPVPPGNDPLHLYSTSFDMTPGSERTVLMKIRNSGNIEIKVTGVGATNGFTTDELVGFDTSIAQGAEINIAFILHAPANLPQGESSTQISLTYQTLGPVCGEPAIVENLNVVYTINPNNGAEAECSCTLSPAGVNVDQNDNQAFTISCEDNLGADFPCEEVDWNVGGITVNWINQNNNGATVQITSAAPANGAITALPEITKDGAQKVCSTCSATIIVGDEPPCDPDVDPECPPPPDGVCDPNIPNDPDCPPAVDVSDCKVVPHSVFLYSGEHQTFKVICYDQNEAEVGYGSLDWLPTIPVGVGLFDEGTGIFTAGNTYAIPATIGAEVTYGNNQKKQADPATITVLPLICADVV